MSLNRENFTDDIRNRLSQYSSSLEKRSVNQSKVEHILQICKAKFQANMSFSMSFVTKHANKVFHELLRLPCIINCFIVFTILSIVLKTLLYDSPF